MSNEQFKWRSIQNDPPPDDAVILFRCRYGEPSVESYKVTRSKGWQHDAGYIVGVITWDINEQAMMKLRDLPNKEWMFIPQ